MTEGQIVAMLGVCAAGLCFAAVVGWVIGRSAGYGVQGFLWGLVLGPVGWIIAAILAGQYRRERQARAEEERRLMWELARRLKEEEERCRLEEERAAAELRMQVARGAEVLGEWTEREVQQSLWDGRLVPEDLWYDQAADAWYPLTEHPRITV